MLAASRDALFRLLCPVILGLSVGAPLVLRVWAPAKYHPDALQVVTTVVILSAVPYTAGLAVSRALLSAGHSRAVATSNVLAAIFNLTLNLLLVPVWGLTGSALATLASYAGLHVMLLRAVPAGLQVPPSSPRRIAALAACGAAALVVASTLPISTAGLVLRTAGALVCLGWFGRVARDVSGRGKVHR